MQTCKSAILLLATVFVFSGLAAPSADTSDIFVAPMLGANWAQGAPMNDLTPRRSPCGCSATAGGQELRLWRWPYRFEKSRTFAHQYIDDDGKWTTYTIRLDGRVPLDWDKIAASGGASTPVASDKETAYNTAMLTAWLQSFAKISFKPGAGSANQKICSEAENWWYEAGPVMSRHRNGYDNLWTAITNDLAFGSPVQINTPVHQMVIDGYAVANAGTDSEVRWINTNYGWGGAICWENFDTATTSGGSAGVFADFQTGYRPQKRVQFEGVPRVSATSVPLVWHLAPCYTNKIDGFTLEIAKFAGETQLTDDFSNSTGVASGEKFKVENGVLGGYPAIQTSYFTYPETYMATGDSVLEFDVQSRYMSGHAATAEICADGGAWETAATIPLSAGKNAAFGTPTHQTVSLAAFAGRTVRLRFKLACTWAGYAAGSSPDFIIDNVSLFGVTGFEETETVEIERDDSTPGVYGYTASGLENGADYAFTVTPVMTDGSAARSNAATTRIGTPAPAPEILGVSSVACGLELVQDGFFIECARGIVNDIAVDCNAAAIDLEALPSHLSILPDEKISVEGENGVFTIHVDATEMAETGKFHDGDMLILTLVATNADGTEAAKNLMLRFNSMRQVMDGTFDVVDSDAATPVWFCGNTTIDAKGQAVVFAAGAFQGTGNVTLVDSTGGGSFTFESLDGFTGTLAFDNGVSVSLPADMSAFAGKISSDVTLESGETMKIAGMEPFTGGITLAGGTLKIALSDADIAYGFSTSEISYITGSVVFVAPDGTETVATQTTGSAFSIAGTANVWTGTDAIFGEKYSTQSAWSAKRLPAEGDYVVFNDASTDGNGALMALNLASAVNLAYVKITGNSYFEIDTFTSDTTAKLSADVLENDIYTKLDKNDFTPKAVVPKAKLLIANGMNLACDIDYTLAQNLKTRNYTANGEYNAIQYDHVWNGTVVFANYAAAGFNPGEYGNAQSFVRMNGVEGYLVYNKEIIPTLELIDNGDKPALLWNNGSGASTVTFDALTGTGTFATARPSSGGKENAIIKDVSGFAGSFNLAAKKVAIADSMPSFVNSDWNDGRLLVNKAATIASGATWTANGGVYLGACELTVAGTLASPLTASAAGARLTLANGGTIVASAAIAGGYSPSLDFKAGTYKIDADVRETNTVNFCAAEGDVTTLDANGHKMTLAASFFSGSGDITLVSSVAGGSFVIEGVSQDFTGTIRLDGEVNVSLPDDLSSIGGTIAISGASLAYSSAKLGPVSVGVGSTLTVSLTDSEAMKGFSASSVTLDGGTIEFVDQYGTTVGSSTESTTYVKPDGYTLAPVPTAVWVSGEFEDEDSLHDGYKITLNDNTVNDSGNIVIGSATTLGATIDTAAGDFTNATVLVKYTIPSGGAPAENAVPAGFFNTKDFGALASKGSSDLRGYWLDGSTLKPDGFAFSSPAPSMPESGYLLISTWALKPNPGDHGTAVYTGATIASLAGGEKTGLRFTDTNNRVTKIAIGGPTAAKAVPWSGMIIEAVAVFGNSWLVPSDVALYEFPEAKAVVPSWAVASVTLQDGNVKYYRDITVAFYEILKGDIDADTVQVLDGSSVDYSGLGFEYDAATQTYSKIKTVIAKIDNGIIMLEFTTLAAACGEADLQNIGVVELLAARDSISEAIPSGWSYVSPADSGTEYGTILKTIAEIPGTVSSIELTQENVSASADGEWAEVSTKPIYLTLPNSVNDFTISFDADIPEGKFGTLVSWDSGDHDIRIVVTNDVENMALWRNGSSGALTAVKDDNAILIPSGEHYVEVIYNRGSGTTVNVDGSVYCTAKGLSFSNNTTTKLALGGSAKGSPDDVLAGLKVKNFRWGKSPTEPGEASENFPVLDYVTLLDGTVYHDNDANRAVITNWQTQITGVAKRPVPEGKADADFSTIDVLFVYDMPGKAYVESNESTWNGASALEVYSAKATAKMNQILCTTDMDTNFWFRMVGVHTVDGTGGTLKEILGKCEGLTGEYKYMLELRDRYGADVIVCPSPNGGGFGGFARLNTLDEIKRRGQNAAYHFATVLLNYSQTHAWVHEIGHNMSLNHYPPANFDPANTWRGLGFQHKIAVDGTPMSSVMAEQGYADFCGGFSSKNHIYHGSRLSISNHLDSTGVLLEAAPYVSQWRSTRVPETAQVECSVTYGSSLPGDTEFALSYPDSEAEIWYQAYGLNNDFVKYTEPFTVPEGAGYAYISAYAVKDGVSTATNLVNYSMFDSTWDTLLGSPKLPWAIYKSIDGSWAAASGEEYLEVTDGFTEKRTAESTLSTTVTGPDVLTFEHCEKLLFNAGPWSDVRYPHTHPDSSFCVWVDGKLAYSLHGPTNTLESWVSTDIAIPEGTHKVDFTYSHRSGYVSGETVRIKSVALASAQELEEPPVDPDSYAIEPLAVWYKDFKTAEKGGYTLSTSGTTAIANDTYGSTLTIGDAAAVIDTSAANTNELTVLVKYTAAPDVTSAPVVAFGGMAGNGTVGLDIGAYTKADKTLAVYRNFSTDNGKPYEFASAPVLSATGGYLLCARNNVQGFRAYVGASLDSMTGETLSNANIKFSNVPLTKIGIGGGSTLPANANDMVPFTGFVVEKIAVFKGYYTPRDLIPIENPEDAATLSIADNATWNFAAGATRTYESIGALSSGGTIAVTNDTIGVGVYKLAEWTTPQQYKTTCAGYGRVGTLSMPGLANGLVAELVYGANAIYLRVYDETAQFLKPTLSIMPYGDSITEGFNAQHTGANYRILLYQKLRMLGYNVRSCGVYGLDDGYDSVDPSGEPLGDADRWHSAKHGAVAGRSTATASGRSDLEENVDTLAAAAGKPDFVLLHIGINDLVSSDRNPTTVCQSVTNIAWRLVNDLPAAKIVLSTVLNVTDSQKNRTFNGVALPDLVAQFNYLLAERIADFPEGRVYLADLNGYVKSDDFGVIYSDGIHPDWRGFDQMAEGWLSVITNVYKTANGPFPSNEYADYVDDSALGAAAKTELADYLDGFSLAQTITVASTNEPTVVSGEGPATGIGKVGYFVEYVRADNETHKWVWVDMDAPATTLEDLGLPTANRQQVVTSLHVKSNHNGIDDIAPDDDSATGFIEFSPYKGTGVASGIGGAPAAYGSAYGWNDTLGTSGDYGCMQIHRVVSTSSAPGGQVLFAYNNWKAADSAAEFGIGNFSQHFHAGTQTFDYMDTRNLEKMNASAYRVKRIEIWTKEAPSNNGKATVVRVHPRLTRGLEREALLGIRFDNALGGNASAFDVKFRLVNCTKADITDIKYWKQPFGHNYGFYEAEATVGPSATVAAGDDATEFTASFPAGSVWFYPQVGTREDSDYLWVTATINPEISPDAEIWVSVPTAKITLSNGGVFDVVNGAARQPHRVFPFVHQVGAYLRQDGATLTGTWAGKLEDSPANRVGNLTDIVVCNDFLVAYDSGNDTFKTTWDACGRDNTAQVARIKALRDQYNPKCMIRGSLTKGSGTITVDGVTGRPIACAAASAARRKQLVDSILAVMESAGLDGLDIDWEYPGDHAVTTANTQRDWHSYGLLMRDLAAAFFDKGYVLSFCSNLGYQMAPDGYHAAFHAADFVNAMAYGNTTLNASPQVMMTGINVCRNRGVPSRRIVVGQAMYAYEVQNPGWGSVVGWLKDEWPSDKTRWWDADLIWMDRSVTKADGTVISTKKETFEGPSSYHAKCNWCRANGYGGVMSWGYYTDVSWDDADLMSLARHQAKSCWPRTNWSWPTPPQDSDGAYLLDSEADWFWLRDNSGAHARFAADIALTHDPLPIETFSGTIDGAEHTLTISNDVWLAYDANPALIRTLTGTVKNLTIDLYGRVVSRASRWNDTTVNTSANTLASEAHNAAVLAANLGAGGIIDGVELTLHSGSEVQGPRLVAGLAANVWVPNGSHAEIRNCRVHVEGVVRALARNTAEGDITVANQCAGGLAGWVGCPSSRNVVVTNNIVSLAATGRVAVETGSSSSAGGVIGHLNNANPFVQGNAVYVASGARVSANESAAAWNVRTSYANASYSIASSVNAGQTTFFIEDGAAALAGSVGGTGKATVEISSYGGEATDGLSVDAVAGFWYSVIYGDRLVSGGIGGETGETEPVKASSTGPLALETPKEGATRFYRVKVSPVGN